MKKRINIQDSRLFRFWNNDMIENIKGVVQNLQAVKGIEAPSPFSSSPIEGEENGREGLGIET
jgi:hypothetical protein